MSTPKTFKDLFKTLCERTGKYDGVAYEGLPVELKYILDQQLRKSIEDWTWPERVLLQKIAVSLTENGVAYINYPDGELLAIYESDPIDDPQMIDMGDIRVFNRKIYLPTIKPEVWVETNPPADTYLGNEDAVVPSYLWDASIENVLAVLLEQSGQHNDAAYKRNYAKKLLEDRYIILAPQRAQKLKVNTR